MSDPTDDVYIWKCRLLGGLGLYLATNLLYLLTGHWTAFNPWQQPAVFIYTGIMGAIYGRATGLAMADVERVDMDGAAKTCFVSCAKSLPLYLLLPFIYQERTVFEIDPACLLPPAWGTMLLFGGIAFKCL